MEDEGRRGAWKITGEGWKFPIHLYVCGVCIPCTYMKRTVVLEAQRCACAAQINKQKKEKGYFFDGEISIAVCTAVNLKF